MTNQDVIDKLNSLIQLDFDATRAYDEAIERMDVDSIREELVSFKEDHERHIGDLSECVESLGGIPEALDRDLKGFLIEGMTSLRSMLGSKQALKAMKMNEELTNRRYEEALRSDLPVDIRAVVQQNREDERRHLEYITEAIEQFDLIEEADRPGA